ncbi:MAG: hypothetical protein ACFE94_18655 [Candidatus Hodarchaeota archaeon]
METNKNSNKKEKKNKQIESKKQDVTKVKNVDKKITDTKPKEISDKPDYSTKEHKDLDIPSVPEPPKKKDNVSIDSPDLIPDVLKRIKKVESPDMKVVLVNCDRCKAVIPIPVPKKVVIDSELPIVPVSYVHKNLDNKDQHCITIHLDHDFDIRRQRLSDVVISSD